MCNCAYDFRLPSLLLMHLPLLLVEALNLLLMFTTYCVLHRMYIIIIVVMTNIMAIMNINISMIKLLVKKFLSGVSQSNSPIGCLLSNLKFLSHVYIGQYSPLVS